MKQEGLLSPECRPVAALLFMSGAVRLHCNFYRLCEVIAEAQNICPLLKLQFEQQSSGLFSRVVYSALARMQIVGFVDWHDNEDLLIIKRDECVFTAFNNEVKRIPRFDNVAVREMFRRAGKLLANSIFNDVPAIRPT
jgi:hypothetical protein